MPFKLIHRPRAPRRQHDEILNEIRPTYENYCQQIITDLMDDIAGWSKKPEFKFTVTVNRKRWQILITVDRRTMMGKIYTWVDEGTAEKGGKGPPYRIPKASKPGKMLAFGVPNYPKTLPRMIGQPIQSAPAAGAQTTVVVASVMHHGIEPRNFTEWWRKKLRSRGTGSFVNITEAAVKRGLRRIGARR